jgi:hypothetical protein
MKTVYRAYLLLGVLAVGLYAWSEAVGWESGTAARGKIEPSVRQSPGGWRSYSSWHRGYHGGK